MNWKNKIWKYATAFVVMLIILNPEMMGLALFVDAVGLEIFLILLEIQVLAIPGILLNTQIKPVVTYIKYLCAHSFPLYSWKIIKEEPGSLLLLAPGQATLMHMLVISAAIGITLNACQ